MEEAKPKSEEEDPSKEIDEEEQAKEFAEKLKEFQFFQNVFDDAGVCRYSLEFIKSKTPLIYTYEAISLLINCLEYGNLKVFQGDHLKINSFIGTNEHT